MCFLCDTDKWSPASTDGVSYMVNRPTRVFQGGFKYSSFTVLYSNRPCLMSYLWFVTTQNGRKKALHIETTGFQTREYRDWFRTEGWSNVTPYSARGAVWELIEGGW